MPTNLPSAAQLLDAVADHLSEDVLDKLSGHDAFNLRVAINALRILQRETTLGPALDEAERRRLAALLHRDGDRDALVADLCGRVRVDRLDHRDPALLDHLMQTALGKLSIDNPKYATYLRALSGARDMP